MAILPGPVEILHLLVARARPPVAPPLAAPPPVHPLQPTTGQVIVLYVTAVYAVAIFGVWNVPGFRNLINPLKLLTIGFHELFHIIATILTGGKIAQISIDPALGGQTLVHGGNGLIILSAGYIGSTLLGALFILGGFDTLVAKVMSFVIAFGLVAPLKVIRDKLTILLTFFYLGLLIGFWFIGHGEALRWYSLFVGVMNILYVVWDVTDDHYFNKVHDSDATQFGIMFPRIPPHVWGMFWMGVQFSFLVAFLLIGIVVFKRSSLEMEQEAARFLPT